MTTSSDSLDFGDGRTWYKRSVGREGPPGRPCRAEMLPCNPRCSSKSVNHMNTTHANAQRVAKDDAVQGELR